MLLHKLNGGIIAAPEGSIMKMLGIDKKCEEAELINNVGDKYDITQNDCVFIENLHVKKEYRGHGLGLFMIDAAINVVNSAMSLTLIKPYPLQYDDENRDYQSKGT